MGKTATHAMVFAQLYTADGACHGLHSFVVPLRDPNTLFALPGVIVGKVLVWSIADVVSTRTSICLVLVITPDMSQIQPVSDLMSCCPTEVKRFFSGAGIPKIFVVDHNSIHGCRIARER